MKMSRISRRFGERMVAATWVLLLYALTVSWTHTLAFHSSPQPLYGRSVQAKHHYRGIHPARNHIVFNGRSKDVVPSDPVHVLRSYFRPQDNLFSGIAEIGMGFSVGVLYSEYSIIMTGCGPLNFSDTLERICYQGVIVYAGLALFNRIVTQLSLEETVDNMFGPLQPSTLWQVRVAEYLSAAAVVGAIIALQLQYTKGVSMDGLSGIDVNMCRAIRGDFG